MTNKSYYICVTPFFPTPSAWQGAYVLDQIKAIQRNSDYEVFVFRGADDDFEYVIDDVRVICYKTKAFPSNILNGFFNKYNSQSFVRRVKSIGIDIQKVVVAHCHISMHAACGLALKEINPNIKVLLQHHDLDPFNLRSGVIGRFNRYNTRYRAKKAIELYNKVDLHVCVSTPVKENLIYFPNTRPAEIFEDMHRVLNNVKGLPHITPKDTYVLYNGVDTELFNPNCGGKRDDRIFRIGCVANFQELKDHKTLVEAFKILVEKGYADIRLSLLGTGETRPTIEAYLKENMLYDFVEWPSEVTHDKLPEYYRSLDLFVLPSYFEGFGCVYTEAYACGVPFIVCYHQGAAECIVPEQHYKWLVEPKNPVQLAELIERYYLKRDKQKLCKEYNINILIKDFLDYIETI